MTAQPEDAKAAVHTGDAAAVLRALPERSVHCVVTSPPFWGLRDYGVDGQIGLEETPEAFVARLVEVFREVRRVLRDDGVMWVEMGDCYATSFFSHDSVRTVAPSNNEWCSEGQRGHRSKRGTLGDNPGRLKPKDLVGQPWRLAFALQADGWYLRADCIWARPNPMPESVTDRPTKAHSYVFLMTKSPRYFYDADAVREAHSEPWRSNGRSERTMMRSERGRRGLVPDGGIGERLYNPAGRNLRTVWTIPTHAFPGAHFATFPPKLVEPCIKAGTSERGCCGECGAPWVRVVERHRPLDGERCEDLPPMRSACKAAPSSAMGHGHNRSGSVHNTTGWRPTCDHDAPTVPCTVLDPFTGAGTVGVVALEFGRRFIGAELNPEYADMARRRIQKFDLSTPLPRPMREQAAGFGPLFDLGREDSDA